MSTNKCGAQTCLLIEKADGPIVGGTAVRRDCGKQSICGDHDPPFVLLQLGDRVWVGTHKTQTEIIVVASVRHTDRPIHRYKLYWFSGGGGVLFIYIIIIVVFVLCCFFDCFGNQATSIIT